MRREIGCGSGGIAHYFGTHPDLRCRVSAVDVVDSRKITEGFDFRLVRDTALPFADAYFDVVVTNHVIEHVGDADAQHRHLMEVRRVMKPDGIAYLAVPNRWQLVEPHYRLAFLSWLPHGWRTPYLKWMGRGEYYDCEPLTMTALEALLRRSGFAFENMCVPAMRLMLEIERPGSMLAKVLRAIPDGISQSLRYAIPTLIYKLVLR